MYNAKLKEVGPDWFTGVSQSQASAELMSDLWQYMLRHEEVGRSSLRKDAWFGYYGQRAEHMFFGTRKEETLLLMSSYVASRFAQDAYEVGARPSRLDLQATFETEKISEQIYEMYELARHSSPATGRPPAVTVLRGRSGEYETLYIGRRSSEVFVRIYNKEKQSREKYYKSCIRFEVELKSHTARNICGRLQNEQWSAASMLGILKGYFLRYGLKSDHFDRYDASVPPVVLHKTSTEGKMAWLLQQVSPTVQALISEVGVGRVASVLFPDGLDTHVGYNDADDGDDVDHR